MIENPHPGEGRRRAEVSEPIRERLYELLPAFLRYRDQSDPLDSPLRALMAALERQYQALDRDIGRLYDDWFIETCQDWIAPYLADLLGVRGLDRPEAWVPGQRTRIANALTYRRLKGTPAVLERVARDVTGWTTVAVPFFERIARNQSLEHIRPDQGRTLDVRDRGRLARFGGPFDTLARRPQISSINGLEPSPSPRAGYNLADLGLYFYRLQSQPARRRTARKIAPGCYTVHPLGIDQPLFARHRSPGELTESITERQVPGPLLREVCAEEVRARRAKEPAATDHLGDLPAVEIFDPRTGRPVPASSIAIADLSAWRRPEPEVAALGLQATDKILVALDPELGRLAFADDYPVAGEVEVSSYQAACGDLGGGPYLRNSEASPGFGSVTVGGPASGPADGVFHFSSLPEALEKRPLDASAARIQIVDSATYGGWSGLDLEVTLRGGTSLEICAAQGETPTFIGDLRVLVEAGSPSRLALEGLAVGGKIEVAAAPPAPSEPAADDTSAGNGRPHRCRLELRDCTVTAPDLAAHLSHGGRTHGANAGIELDPATAAFVDLAVRIESSIVGRIAVPSGCGSLVASDSIIDGGAGAAIAGSMTATEAFGCAAELTRCTIFGPVAVERVVAEDTIFAEPVTASAGNRARFDHCYLAPGSTSGRREKCHPAGASDGGSANDSGTAPPTPLFTSRTYGQAGYAQLGTRSPREIRTGSSNGSEIGAFATLGNPFREANLTGILEEYMPWGLVPRVFHVT